MGVETPARRRGLPAGAAPWVVLALDGSLTAASLWLAMLLRFEGQIPWYYRDPLPAMTTLLVGCRLLVHIGLRLHRWSFRFSGLADGARVGLAALSGSGLFLGLLYLIRDPGPPRSVVVLELLLSGVALALVRFSPRLAGMYAADWGRGRRKGAVRTVILGGGAAGDMLLRDLLRSPGHDYHVLGFLDDDAAKRAQIVGGRPVLGAIDELPRIVRQLAVEQVLIAIPRLAGRRVREILSLCADLKLRFKILPVSYVYLQQRAVSSAMQDLSPADLLQREPVSFERLGDGVDLGARTAFVTGAAGSIGSEICEQLLRAGLGRLVLSDLNENGLYLALQRLTRDFPRAELTLEVADIRDAARMRELLLTHRPHDVFHAAAHKHVPLMESAPAEAVKNNVLGTRNVAEAAHEAGAARLIYVSTDKAVRPTSVMGATKRVGELVVRALAARSATRCCCVRFGNVLGSAGSVVPLFLEQIAAGGPVSVTHPEVRRYFMTIPEAVALVLEGAYHDYGELCVLDMGEPLRIVDLARHLITMSGLVPERDVPIVFSGLRPGEKLTEELLTEDEERTRQVHRSILVAESAPAPAGLSARLAQLDRAAHAGDLVAIVGLLQELVPSYTPSAALSQRLAGSAILRPRRAAGSSRASHP